uniref:UDP-glycosyltransferase 90A1-like n=2 Tax=Nicotiana TaxID=4085 RepID=A0A1S3XRP8_TOBAC|nr:PREDICTED: UDP-glycosyltransferase 90A1-like [Nicotiana sylvestris]XP_016442549.1 PREDICTED: UDP-glycosyltransferase 90A1-like [Nicotiana tabacum]
MALMSLIPPITFMITDRALSWTLDSANKFDIPRLSYHTMSPFSTCMGRSSCALLRIELSDNEPFTTTLILDVVLAWCIGPSCEQQKAQLVKPASHIMKWLDEMLQQGKLVLYVAFGTQAQISPEQFKEIKIELEKSQVNFLWVVRRNTIADEVNDRVGFDFKDRVKNRGLVVTEWVDQIEILSHESVQGFLSHCGWNSIIESICANVPILAWPMMGNNI